MCVEIFNDLGISTEVIVACMMFKESGKIDPTYASPCLVKLWNT